MNFFTLEADCAICKPPVVFAVKPVVLLLANTLVLSNDYGLIGAAVASPPPSVVIAETKFRVLIGADAWAKGP